jgi:Domain of unknown function (DUF5122) beta-propeller
MDVSVNQTEIGMNRGVLQRGAAVAIIAVTSALLPLTPAQALTETPDTGMSRTTGKVLAIAQLGDIVFMGGHFLSVTTLGGGGKRTVQNLAAFDADTGLHIPEWGAGVTNTNSTAEPRVEELAISADQQWLYVGGNFDTVNGEPAKNFAAVDVATGAVVDQNFLPIVNQTVRSMLVGNGRIYIGGQFKKVDGITRNHLAAFAPDGTLDATWTPSAAHTDPNHSAAVHAMVFSTDGQTIFVGGAFNQMNGVSRASVARVSPTTGELDLWQIPQSQVGTNVAWDLLPTSTRLYAGFGDGPNWVASYRLDLGTLGTQAWRKDYVGNIQDLAFTPDSSRLFVAGHNGTAHLQQEVCGENIRGLLLLDPTNGNTDCSWIPQVEPWGNNFIGVWTILRTGNHLWVGGKITHISGVRQGAFARFTI